MKLNFIKRAKEKVSAIQIDNIDNLGTDKIKEVLFDALQVSNAVIQIIQGKIVNAVGIIFSVGVKYQGNFKIILAAGYAQFKDLDEAEAEDVLNYLKLKFDIEDDELEAKIEGIFALPVEIFKEVNDWKDVVEMIGNAFKDGKYDVVLSREAAHRLVDELHDGIEILQGAIGLIQDFKPDELEEAA